MAPSAGRACGDCWSGFRCRQHGSSTQCTAACEALAGRAGCRKSARPDLWEPWGGNCPGRPGKGRRRGAGGGLVGLVAPRPILLEGRGACALVALSLSRLVALGFLSPAQLARKIL